MLSMLEQALRSAANNNPQMMYGNNLTVINNMLSTIAMVNNMKNTLQMDNSNDAYSMNLRSKIFELENIIATYGQQKLMSFGINIGSMQPQMSPLTANQPMYNQPMYYSNVMGSQQQQMPVQMPQMPQPQMQQPSPQMPQVQQPPPPSTPVSAPVAPQASQPAPAPAPAPAAPAPAAPAPAFKPADMPTTITPQASSTGGSMGFPGMGGGGDDKAQGRDYLLKLLSEK